MSLLPLGAIFGCAMSNYNLAPSGGAAMLDPIGECATEGGLQAVRHPDSVNAKLGGSWVQFMARPNDQLDLVIILGSDVPQNDRPAREQAAKAKADEVYACAKQRRRRGR